ncbi:hypothetical protein [Minwuia sp.]|uniref:hypothetical protein n=1 Tax=Minwuia sp. TaxID=2493630 RepID=UPI003A9254B1
MDYRSIEINEINALNQTVIEDQAQVDAAMANMDYYIRRGKSERARVTLNGLRAIRNSIRGLFA